MLITCKAHANPQEAWYCLDHHPWELEWAHRLGLLPGVSIPLSG